MNLQEFHRLVNRHLFPHDMAEATEAAEAAEASPNPNERRAWVWRTGMLKVSPAANDQNFPPPPIRQQSLMPRLMDSYK